MLPSPCAQDPAFKRPVLELLRRSFLTPWPCLLVCDVAQTWDVPLAWQAWQRPGSSALSMQHGAGTWGGMTESFRVQSLKSLIGWRSAIFAAFVGLLAVPLVFGLTYREKLLRPEVFRSCACFLGYIRHGPVIIDAPAVWVRYRLSPYVPESKCTVSSRFDAAVPRNNVQVISGRLCTWPNFMATSAVVWLIGAFGSAIALALSKLCRVATRKGDGLWG